MGGQRASVAIALGTTLAGAALYGVILWRATPVPVVVPPPPPPVVLPPPKAGETPEEIEARKQKFTSLLLPIIREENRRLLVDRERIDRIEQELNADDEISRDDFEWIKQMAGDYDLDPKARRNSEFFNSLRRRVDIVPSSLIIAQAALESGWGRSEVTRESNNFFGHYCYEPGCGVPAPGIGDLRVFKSAKEAVQAYVHNINSHAAYRELRNQRQRLRAAGQRISGSALAPALGAYSERGQAYIDDLKSIIRSNDLDELPNL